MKRKVVSIASLNPYFDSDPSSKDWWLANGAIIPTHDEYGRVIFLDLEDFHGATITETVFIHHVVEIYVWISQFPDSQYTLEFVDTWAADTINRVKYK